MRHLGILAISVVLIAAAVWGDGAPEAAEQSPVNKAAYTVWFPAEPIQDQNATVLIRNRREISISDNNDAIKRLSSFIKDNIQKYSKINLRGVKNFKINVNRVKVNDLYSLVKVGQTRKDNILLRTGKFYVENEADSVAESQSHAYTYTRTHTESITVSKTVGFSGAITFPLKVINNLSPTVSFSNGRTSTKTETIEESVTIPPQKVVLNPKSKRQLTYNFFREELVEEYRATFLVDRKSTFNVSYTSMIPGNYFFHKIKISKDLNLMDFLKEMHEKNRKINIPSMEYDYKNQKLIMKDYPVTRDVINDIVKIVFGAEEPLK